MLYINFFNKNNATESINNISFCVNFEKSRMMVELLKKQIEYYSKKAANTDFTTEIRTKAAKQAEKLQRQQKALEKDIAIKKENYENIINLIISAKNEYTQNNKQAATNLFRLIASGDDRRLIPYVLPDLGQEVYNNLYTLLTDLHTINKQSVNDNGIYKKQATDKYHTLTNELKQLFYNTFSIPVANDVTAAVKVNIHKATLAEIHENWITGTNAKTQKAKAEKSKESATLYKGLYHKTKITRTVKKDNVIYDGKSFNALMCELAYEYIINKKDNAAAIAKKQNKKDK